MASEGNEKWSWHDRVEMQGWIWQAYSSIPYKRPSSAIGRSLRQIPDDRPCVRCRGINLEDLLSAQGYLHAPDFSTLLENSSACRLCDLILALLEKNSLSQDISKTIKGPLQIILFISGVAAGNPITPEARLKVICQGKCECSSKEQREISGSELCHCLSASNKIENDISICSLGPSHELLPVQRAHAINPNPLSDSAIDRARSWLHSCLENHDGCQQTIVERSGEKVHEDDKSVSALGPKSPFTFHFPSPIRLLQIKDVENQRHIKVVTLHDNSLNYVALSHRWNSGPMPSWVTRKENLDEHFSSLDATKFPKTILDAMIISRKLGLDYIWIDCFCIVQDDAEDWATQAAQMGDIYLHAQLTICADVATDDDSGFLHPREPMGEPYVSFNVRIGDTESSIVHARYYNYNDGETLLWAPDSGSAFYHNVIYSALNRRGWTLQERVLSPRILHFGVNQMFWECRHCIEAEDGHNVPSLEAWKSDIEAAFFSASISDFQVFKAWTALVVEYTKRQLTVSYDILPAVSAIARSIATRTGATYLAGLWKETLHLDLLWWISDPHSPIHQHGKWPDSWGGPSWSWTSVCGVARFEVIEKTNLTGNHGERQEDFRSAIELLNVQLDLSSSLNPFGRVEKGLLTIRGPVVQVAYQNPLFKKGTELLRTSKALEKAKAQGTNVTLPFEGWGDPVYERWMNQLRLSHGQAGTQAAYHDSHTREGSADLYAVLDTRLEKDEHMFSRSQEPIGVMFYDVPDNVPNNDQLEDEETWMVATALKTVDIDIKKRGISVFANCLILLEVPFKLDTFGRRGVGYIWGDRMGDWFENAERRTLTIC